MNIKKVEKRLVLKKVIKRKLNKLLISIIICLIGMILVKKDPSLKGKIVEKVYENSLPFTKVKRIYQKYFGEELIARQKENTQPVFQEKLSYQKVKKYEDGVELMVEENYQVPVLEAGIIVFMGKKEKYGNTIIVEQVDGIDTFYANITTHDKKLYDYVEKGEMIGQANQNKIYLAFQKDGTYLDYQKYI